MKKLCVLAVVLLTAPLLWAQPAPNIVSTDVHGNAVDMYAMRDAGNTVVLDFFFADCPPCQAMMPFMVDIYEEFGNGNLDLRGISVSDRDDAATVIAFENDYGATWHSIDMVDGNGIIYADYASIFTFAGFPTISVLCPDNTFTWDIWGTDYAVIAADIRQAILDCGARLATGVENPGLQASVELAPNPANTATQLRFELTNNSRIQLEVFNILGEFVLDLGAADYSAGPHNLQLDLEALTAGSYVLRISDSEGLSDEVRLQIIR